MCPNGGGQLLVNDWLKEGAESVGLFFEPWDGDFSIAASLCETMFAHALF